MDADRVHHHDDRSYAWVGRYIQRRAMLTPDAPAVTDAADGRTWTYAELNNRAQRLAAGLVDNGIEAGDRIALISRNRIECIDLFAATARCGALLAPISHRLAPPTVAELVELVDPSMIVVEDRFVELLAEAERTATLVRLVDDSAEVPGVDKLASVAAADPSGGSQPGRSLADPHLLLHTGGTTGTPKETVLTHGSILWNSINTVTGWGLRPDDVTPMVFPFFHTGGWNVLTVPMLHMGGHLIIDRDVNPAAVLEAIDRHDATVLVAVPAVLRAMAESNDFAETDISTLRFVKSGGGPCRQEVIEAWRDRGVDLSQGYGLTECGPNNFAMPPGGGATHPESVGKPMPHVDARIVDESGRAVGIGSVGELELASPHAADGYWRNEPATAEVFGDGWVSTGDLARQDAEGFVYIEGRRKHLFVSGGENVYPSEVERAIADHPAVDDVIVLGVPDETWGEVGMAVIEGDGPPSLKQLRAFLDGRLARYKHPHYLRTVEQLPTSGPEKIDRQALRDRFEDTIE